MRALSQRANLMLSPLFLRAFGMKTEVVRAIGGSAGFSQYCFHAARVASNIRRRIIDRFSDEDPSRVGVIVSAKLAHCVSCRFFLVLINARQCIHEPIRFGPSTSRMHRIGFLLACPAGFDVGASISAVQTSIAFLYFVHGRKGCGMVVYRECHRLLIPRGVIRCDADQSHFHFLFCKLL